MAEGEIQREREPERRRILKKRKRKAKRKITPMKLKETYGIEVVSEEEQAFPSVEIKEEEEYLLPEEEKERTKERIKTKISKKQSNIEKKASDINAIIKSNWQHSLSRYVNEVLNYTIKDLSYDETHDIGKAIYTYLDYIAGSVISDREGNPDSDHIHLVQQYFDPNELNGILFDLEVPDYQREAASDLLYNNFDGETNRLEEIIDKGLKEYQEYLEGQFARKPRPANVWKAILHRKSEFSSKKIRELDSNAYLRAIAAKMIRPAVVVKGFEAPEKVEYETSIEAIEHPELEPIDADIEETESSIAILKDKEYSEGLDDHEIDFLDDLFITWEDLQEARRDKIEELIRRGYE